MTNPDESAPIPHDPGPTPHDPDHAAAGADPWTQSVPGAGSWQSADPSASTAGDPHIGHGSGPLSTTSDLTRLLTRQFVIPAAALAVAVIAILASVASSGGGGNPFANSSSDAEVCSAYRAAERSWDSWSTDATEIEKLGSVASRHSDEDVRSAGQSLNNLSGMFSYGRYSTIVQPITRLC